MGTYRLFTNSQGLSEFEDIDLTKTPEWTPYMFMTPQSRSEMESCFAGREKNYDDQNPMLSGLIASHMT